MKRIIHIIIGLGRGGAEKALTRLLEGQRGNLNYEHVVISLTDMGRYGESIQQMGVPVHALGLNGTRGLPLIFIKLLVLLRKLQPDIVQTWMYHADLLGGLAAKLAGSPPVLWGIRTVDLGLGANPSTRIVRKLCALLSSWLPTLILCVAEAARKSHIAVGYDESRMLIVPNGFDVAQEEIADVDVFALRTAYGLSPDHLVIGCVGRFHPDKDHRNFVDAAILLRDEYPQARFMMVGPGLDASNSVLGSWIEAGDMKDRFTLLGERSDIPLYLKAMDIFCSPSRTEAFPQVVGEAMRVGRPAVVTDVGDTSLVVGETAIIVERENAQALAKGMAKLLGASAAQRDSLGRQAQARVCREFSIERTIELTVSAYVQALNQ